MRLPRGSARASRLRLCCESQCVCIAWSKAETTRDAVCAAHGRSVRVAQRAVTSLVGEHYYKEKDGPRFEPGAAYLLAL